MQLSYLESFKICKIAPLSSSEDSFAAGFLGITLDVSLLSSLESTFTCEAILTSLLLYEAILTSLPLLYEAILTSLPLLYEAILKLFLLVVLNSEAISASLKTLLKHF